MRPARSFTPSGSDFQAGNLTASFVSPGLSPRSHGADVIIDKSQAVSLVRSPSVDLGIVLADRARMKILVTICLFALASACADPDAKCRAVALGQPLANPGEVDGNRYLIGTFAFGNNHPSNFTKGPAEEITCCAIQAAGHEMPRECAHILPSANCADWSQTQVTTYDSYQNEQASDSQNCYVAVRDNTVVAVWSRRWF